MVVRLKSIQVTILFLLGIVKEFELNVQIVVFYDTMQFYRWLQTFWNLLPRYPA
jgi:hypothetical protein